MPSELDETNPEMVRRVIHHRGEEIKQRELKRALNRLTTRYDFTQNQQEIIENMASAIVDEILTTSDSMLDHAAEFDDNTVRTAIELFDPCERQ